MEYDPVMNSIFSYWGKTRQGGDGAWEWHLLVYHCLDVAASADEPLIYQFHAAPGGVFPAAAGINCGASAQGIFCFDSILRQPLDVLAVGHDAASPLPSYFSRMPS